MNNDINTKLTIIFIISFLIFNLYLQRYIHIITFISVFIILKMIFSESTYLLLNITLFLMILDIIHKYTNGLFDCFTTDMGSNDNKYFDIMNNISHELIQEYIKQTKIKTLNTSVKISQIIPTRPDINVKKINEMSKKNKILNAPLIITKDNFIIDGHHRWYLLKQQKKTDYVSVEIIQDNINVVIKSMLKFKNDYNDKLLQGFRLDLKKIKTTQQAIKDIKKNLSIIDKYSNELTKLNII